MESMNHLEMSKSKDLKHEANAEENDLKAMGLYIKSAREKRGEDFKEDILPRLLEIGYYIECDEAFSKYTITTNIKEYGTIDFFPKKNKILIRKSNTWKTGGRQFIEDQLLTRFLAK